MYKIFKRLVEKHSGKTVKTLRINRGGDYTSNELENYCSQHEIIHEFTTPYNPIHDELVEERNISVLKMARSMFKHKGLTHNL